MLPRLLNGLDDLTLKGATPTTQGDECVGSML
jgi:hypothetical protein